MGLEKFIEANREKFDSLEPSDDVWNKIIKASNCPLKVGDSNSEATSEERSGSDLNEGNTD